MAVIVSFITLTSLGFVISQSLGLKLAAKSAVRANETERCLLAPSEERMHRPSTSSPTKACDDKRLERFPPTPVYDQPGPFDHREFTAERK